VKWLKDLGYGTAYETAIVRDLLDHLIAKYEVEGVLQEPVTDLLDYFELESLTEPMRSSEASFDLVWNFCQFEQMSDQNRFMEDASSKTRKYILIIIQNNRNPGLTLHWIYHKIRRKHWDHGSIRKMSPRKLRKAIAGNNLAMCEDGFHDIPWFIIDVYECGDFLKKLVPESLRNREKIEPSRFERMPRIVKSFLAHHYYVLAKRPLAE
jgi:hypothetical protein